MGTVVALATDGGIVIAGDSREVENGTVTSRRLGRVLDFGDVGSGVVGDAGDVQTFGRRLESELGSWRLEREDDVEIQSAARMAATVAAETGVAAIVGAFGPDGTGQLREVAEDGRTVETSTAALGSGAEIALGVLDSTDPGASLEAMVSTAREAIDRASDRDTGTGGRTDVWSLSHNSS
jgi:proteasome beta subunit